MNKQDFRKAILPEIELYKGKFYDTIHPRDNLVKIINDYTSGKYGTPDDSILESLRKFEPYFNGTYNPNEDARDNLQFYQNELKKALDSDLDGKVEKKEIKQAIKEEMTPEEKAKIKGDIEEAVSNEDSNAEFREPTGMYNTPAAMAEIFKNNRNKENLGTAFQKKWEENFPGVVSDEACKKILKKRVDNMKQNWGETDEMKRQKKKKEEKGN